MSKKISIVIPVYNEEQNIPRVHEELENVWKDISYLDNEIIFVNDGSKDGSEEAIRTLCKVNPNVKYLTFARNFGKEIALTAGLFHATGDAAIMLDADLQHPIELIPLFVKEWEDGHDVVVGVRHKSKSDGVIRRVGSRMFYRIIAAMGDTFIEPRATDFRLIDRTVIDEFNRFTERNRMTRGLIDWLGFKRTAIYFHAKPRTMGEAQYSTIKLIRLAFSTFVSHSLFPLRFAGYLGIFIMTTSALLGMFVFVEEYILHDPLSLAITGTALLALMILFLVGIMLSCLGLIALYIASIHNEVVNRPLYVLGRKENF